jgi:amidase/aspartyl-tRNA(Asn)/glutamyl-tRNA(Gln) amidotransferase subunit A
VTPRAYATLGAADLAAQVRRGEASARAIAEAALVRIDALDRRYNAFTAIARERALRDAAAIDAARARGESLPPLAGVPFAVKNLFDVAGLTTLAGAAIERDKPAARADATVVARLAKAGAVLVGALNMEEYAYGFVTENAHYGAVRNPHDEGRVAGGSSGGSAAALAAGIVPLTLGSDTNGSIRVPAALCGVCGLKPTYGRLSRQGAALFASSLDHVGPMTRSVADLALAYDAMQGADAADIACAQRDVEPTLPGLDRGLDGLRIGVAAGYFHDHAGDEARAALDVAAKALGATRRVTLPEVERARAAGFIITASEGAELHLPDLRTRAGDFDFATRDRFLAGAMIPASWYVDAQRFRAWFRARVHAAFADVDVILAAATPVPATPIGATTFDLHGEPMPPRTHLGLLTHAFAFAGLPVATVPIDGAGLPLGVQLVAAPWREDLALRAARALEIAGVSHARVAPGALGAGAPAPS